MLLCFCEKESKLIKYIIVIFIVRRKVCNL